MFGKTAELVYDLEDAEPGSFALTLDDNDRIDGMRFVCPCGCRRTATVEFSDHGKMDWNRRPEAITITFPLRLMEDDRTTHLHVMLLDGKWHGVQ